MQSIFGSAGLTAVQWLKVLAAGLLVFSVAELEKLVIRRSRSAAEAFRPRSRPGAGE